MNQTSRQVGKQKWHHPKLVVTASCVGLLFIFSAILDFLEYPDYFASIRFDWDATAGFKAISVGTPGNVDPFTQTYRALIAAQAKPWISSEFRKEGWKEAKGRCFVLLLPFPPLVYGLDRGAEPWEIIDPEVTPLMHAAERDDIDLVRRLLASGADVNAHDQRGWTALMHASMTRLAGAEIFQALLAAGADVNAKDRVGRTALIWAAKSGGPATVSQLLAARADPNARSNYGETALLEAVGSQDSLSVAAELLAAGADPNARDSKGTTALSGAKAAGKTQMIQLLRREGARD